MSWKLKLYQFKNEHIHIIKNSLYLRTYIYRHVNAIINCLIQIIITYYSMISNNYRL